jgi:hypothetical protein
MGNYQISKIVDLGQHTDFISERTLCTEPLIRIGIFLCTNTNEPRAGIRVENQQIYGLKHYVYCYNALNYFFDNHIRLIINRSLQLTLFYKNSLFIKEVQGYKPILFGNSREFDRIYEFFFK